MPRYFIEVSYKGTAYSGFQIQKNGITIQEEIEKALKTYFKQPFSLTGASRTDAGVHALQNFFHFDVQEPLQNDDPFSSSKVSFLVSETEKSNELSVAVYSLNAILEKDIVIKRIFRVNENLHCRFDAVSREYEYYIYSRKDPFLQDRAFYYPYQLNVAQLNKAAALLSTYSDFATFSKRNTQVKHFICDLKKSEWVMKENMLVYNVKANRFLRGMVKGLVGTMLKAGRGLISLEEFQQIIESKDCRKADFSVASRGLFLVKVEY